VDRALAAIAKVQVQAEIGPDFPHALRAILRQDPDIHDQTDSRSGEGAHRDSIILAACGLSPDHSLPIAAFRLRQAIRLS
jgi:hypothetical protein